MVLPFMPIIFFNQGKLAMEVVGLILAITIFIQFGGGIIGGIVADKVGLKKTMIVALCIRTLGFLILIFSFYSIYIAIPAMLLITTGSALYLPANKAYIIHYVSDQDRACALAYLNSALSAGMAIGPLFGGFFISNHPTLLFFVVFLIFLLVTIFHTNKIQETSKKRADDKKQNYFAGIHLKVIITPLLFNAASFYIYFFFQNYMGPFVAHFYSPKLYSILLSINCLLAFFIQPMMAKWIKNTNYSFLLFLSFFLMAIAMGLIAANIVFLFFMATILLTFAEVFLILKNDLEIVDRLPQKPATAFGLQRLTAGIGASLSSLLGGTLFSIFNHAGTLEMFWMIVLLQSAFIALIALCSKTIYKNFLGD
jgi:MFS family permease